MDPGSSESELKWFDAIEQVLASLGDRIHSYLLLEEEEEEDELLPAFFCNYFGIKGVARIWFRGGGTHFGGGGGPTPYFSPQTPNHKGPPLCTFGYLRISGGGPAPPPPRPPPGYALVRYIRRKQNSTGSSLSNLSGAAKSSKYFLHISSISYNFGP